MTDEWMDRWLNAQLNELEKVERCSKERYDALDKGLRSVELELISLSAAVQEVRASLDSIANDFSATSVQFTDMIRQNSDSILKHATTCPHPEQWKQLWDRTRVLEDMEKRREGAGKWESLILNAVITIIVSITVIIIAYLMSGGHITS